MKHIITKIWNVFMGIFLIGLILITFPVLAFDLLIFGAKLFLLIPISPQVPIEGPWVVQLSLLGAWLAGGFVLLLGTGMAVSAARRRAPRSQYRPAAILLLVVLIAGLLALLMPAIPTAAPEIALGPQGAQPTSMEYGEGIIIRFTNISSQRQTLCTGSRTTCQAVNGGPAEFAPPGLILMLGQSADVKFPIAGDYHLISPTTPSLHVEIIVDAPDPNRFSPCDVMQCW